MPTDLAQYARKNGVKYFMISYTDLFSGQRAKLVPAAAIGDMQKDGAGFAGFATWLDLTPAHPDMFAMPDPAGVMSSQVAKPAKPAPSFCISAIAAAGTSLALCPPNRSVNEIMK